MAEDKSVQDEEEILDSEDEGDDLTPDNEVDQDQNQDPEKDQDEDSDENLKIPVRSRESHIIARQKRTIERLRSKADDDVDNDDFNNDVSDEDDDRSPSAIEREVNRQLDPIRESLLSKADEDDLNGLISKEPDAKKYEKRIRAYMKHDAYKSVAPEVIYNHLAWQEAQAIGAKRKQVADTEANQMRNAGSPLREDPGSGEMTAEDIDRMSEKEFAAYEEKQRRLAARS